MDQREAIEKVRAYKQLLMKQFQIDKIYLFGSFAKNTQHDDSDIDVAVVVKQINDDFFSTNPILWTLRRKIDERIEPLLIDRNNDDAGFLKEIEKYGIEIE